jgi:hypothetical protein
LRNEKTCREKGDGVRGKQLGSASQQQDDQQGEADRIPVQVVTETEASDVDLHGVDWFAWSIAGIKLAVNWGIAE